MMIVVVLGYISFDPQKSKVLKSRQTDALRQKTDWLAVFIIQFLLPKKIAHIDVDLAKYLSSLR